MPHPLPRWLFAIALGSLICSHADAQKLARDKAPEERLSHQSDGRCAGDGACSADDEQRPTLRVLSYNVHHCAGVDGKLDVKRIGDVIRSVRPDLVALQEVDRGTGRANGEDQIALLAKQTDMHMAFGKNIAFDGGRYGNAILSRYPITHHKNRLLPNHRDGEQRGVLVAKIKLPEQPPLTFCCTHFDHRRPDSERIASAKQVNQWLAKWGPRTILAGDLNDVRGSATLNELGRKWTLAGPESPTVPVGEPQRQIDFILLAKQAPWGTDAVRVLDEKVASDHRPILAILATDAQ